MRQTRMQPFFLIYLVVFTTLISGNKSTSLAFQTDQEQDVEETQKRTVEPVFRVSKLTDAESSPNGSAVVPETLPPVSSGVNSSKPSPALVPTPTPTVVPTPIAAAPTRTPHPLDDAIQIANDTLENIRANLVDYTAVLVKRERVNDVLGEQVYMQIKVRNERDTPQGRKPFSVYMKFLKPRDQAGREVIWVKGQNNNSLIAHEGGGVLKFKRFTLDPDGWLAMKGNKYPIYEAGLQRLVEQLIEKAERDRSAGMCEVEYRPNTTINKRSCSMIQVIHEDRRPPYEFYKAQVFIDDELQLPVRYVSYDWPKGGQQPEVLEEYTYINVRPNVGLSDIDFSPENPLYRFPK